MKNFIIFFTTIFLFALVCYLPVRGVAQEEILRTPSAGQKAPTENQSVKGIKLKGKAPVNKQPLKVNLPRPQEATLANGLKILLLEDRTSDTFNMQMMFINAGSVADPAGKKGTAAYTAGLMRSGTTQRTSREIAEQLAAIGSTLLTRSTAFVSSVNATGFNENFEKTFNIFSDIIRHPSFPQEEAEKYRDRLRSVLLIYNSAPEGFTNGDLNKIIYGEHPSAFVNPPEASINTFKTEDLTKFHATYYHPNNAVLAVTGAITMPELERLAEIAFSDWQKGELPPIEVPSIKVPTNSTIHLFDRPSSVQTTLLLGSLGVDRKNDDFYPLLVMSQILGGGPTGRLFMNLREDKGYTYGAYSSFGASNVPGLIRINTDVRNEVTAEALKELMLEVKRINEQKVSPLELENAKHTITGKFALSLDNPRLLLANIIEQNIYDLPADYWDMYAVHINSVTTEDVQRVAQRYLNPATIQIIAAGNAAAVRPILEKYGAVKVIASDVPVVPTILRGGNGISNP